jgi:hypothetical protein
MRFGFTAISLMAALSSAGACAAAELTVSGTRFLLDGNPFPYTGISFFNAIHNQAFNNSSEDRRQWLRKFQKYGVNVIRVWGQWDNKRGFVDSCPECSLYMPNGELRPGPIGRLKQICADADAVGAVVEVALFSQESWHDGIKLSPEGADRAVAAVSRELQPYRNVVLQIWNEFDERALDHVKTIKAIDPKRLVTNSPGVAGVLTGMRGEMEALDFLSPHTSRQGAGRTWEIAPKEIAYLLSRWRKPVVDDEPARNGTPQFGGPKETTSPYDHILQIRAVWQAGGYVIYHHDMFQMGKGHPTVPPTGIPDPEFNPYHRQVLEFLGMRHRYMPE